MKTRRLPAGAIQVASRLIRARTPSARLYEQYRDSADLYVDAHRGRRPLLRLREGRETAAHLGFRRSILFGRAYLVAWVEDEEAFREAVPATDAITSPLEVPGMPVPLPLIMAPGKCRRLRSESFLSVLEHEIMHVNQMILGFSIPELKADYALELLECFFIYVRLEHEAHFIQSVRWPPPLTFDGITLSLDQWVLLRAYTPALEDILRGTAMGRIPKNILQSFLDAVPSQAPGRLARMGCPADLLPWFQARWSADVSCALGVLRSQGVDPKGAPLQPVRAWLRKESSPRGGSSSPRR